MKKLYLVLDEQNKPVATINVIGFKFIPDKNHVDISNLSEDIKKQVVAHPERFTKEGKRVQ